MVQVKSVGSVGFCMRRVVVDLEEDAVYAGGHGGASQYGDKFGLASGDSICSGRRLD